MKKALALLMLCTVFMLSCSSEDSEYVAPEPIDIERSIGLSVPSDGSMAIVSNKYALRKVIPNGYRHILSKVDFAKNNLLLIYGVSPTVIAEITKKQTETKEGYKFDIVVSRTMLCAIEPWCIAYKVSKRLKPEDVSVEIRYEEPFW